jgi:hypothetical protein
VVAETAARAARDRAMSRTIWESIADLARYAPTPHNTQPFRIRPLNSRAAHLLILEERMLPAEDSGNMYVMASFGIFAETLERAARHFGYVLCVTALDAVHPGELGRGRGPVIIGRADIVGTCTPEDQQGLLLARRTSRLPYDNRLVPQHVLTDFSAVAEKHGHRFDSFDDPDIVRDVLSQNVKALLRNNLKKAELVELRRWIRVAGTPQLGDGLWPGPMNQPRWEMRLALAAPWLFVLPVIESLTRLKYLRTQGGTRHVAILRGPFQSWPELVRAGRMLMQLWLTMAIHGVYMLPFGSMITYAPCNAYLKSKFAADDIWFILRFGYSATPPKAPRLRSVLLPRAAVIEERHHAEPVAAAIQRPDAFGTTLGPPSIEGVQE